jgi:HK97 family phage major capsid protein
VTRRELLSKATMTTTVAGSGALAPPAVSERFFSKIKDVSPFGQAIDQETVVTTSGTINQITSGARLIRAAAENADDGYRAEVSFPSVPYATKKVRLPWEVTLDLLRRNIEGKTLEGKVVDEMARQWALDLDDLNVNGDEAAGAGPDQAFLQIDDGLLKKAAALAGAQRIDGSLINGGAIDKSHFFAIVKAMPSKFDSSAKFFMSPKRKISWLEALTARATSAGDAVLAGASGGPGNQPLGRNIVEVPFFPDDRVIYSDPKNFVRVLSLNLTRYRVLPTTDFGLATREKIGYVWFLEQDFIIRESAAVIDLHTLDPV